MDGLAPLMRRTLLLALVLAPLLPVQLAAQATTGPDGRTVVPRDTSSPQLHKTLFTYRDAALAAAFAGLTIAMFPVDRHIAQQLQREDLRNNKLFENPAKGVE